MLPPVKGITAWHAAQLRDAGVETVLGEPPDAAAADDEARTVAVTWVGEPALFDNPVTQYRVFLTRHNLPPQGGLSPYTREQLAALEAAMRIRIIPFPGHTRELGPRDGLSREYRWGHAAGSRTIPVRYADAEKIKASPSGHEFRLPDEPESPFATVPTNLRLVGATEYEGIGRYVLRRTTGATSEE
ncbi:MAG TPA: hypothetical protein VH475_23185 [Tepidisphaeraceae bacterium]|jgi:hypothetical protein